MIDTIKIPLERNELSREEMIKHVSDKQFFKLLRATDGRLILLAHGEKDGTFTNASVKLYAKQADVVVICHPNKFKQYPVCFPKHSGEVFVNYHYGNLVVRTYRSR